MAQSIASRIIADRGRLLRDLTGFVKLPAWHQERVVLVGDAAYGSSAMKGMGTTSAIVGSYVLTAFSWHVPAMDISKSSWAKDELLAFSSLSTYWPCSARRDGKWRMR